MTYDTAGEAGYDGELYFHYDHLGNTTLLTNPQGSPVASFQYDLHSGKIVNEWNPSGLEVMNINFFGIGYEENNLKIIFKDALVLISTIYSIININSSFILENSIIDWYRPPVLRRCECDPPPKYEPGIVSGDFTNVNEAFQGEDTKIEDMTCEQLEKGMSYAKMEFDFVNETSYDFKLGDIDNPHDAEDVFEKDTENIKTATYDVCEYWQMKEELMKRQARGDCL
jgi:hypothetical protein